MYKSERVSETEMLFLFVERKEEKKNGMRWASSLCYEMSTVFAIMDHGSRKVVVREQDS